MTTAAKATAADWTPVRSGKFYCSPACGGGRFCTWAEHELAIGRAEALAALLGDGWVPVVWENLGWHYCATKNASGDRVTECTVYGHHDLGERHARYSLIWNAASIAINEPDNDPRALVREAVKLAVAERTRLSKAIAALEA